MKYFLVDESKTTAPTAPKIDAIISPVNNVVELCRQLLEFIEKKLILRTIYDKDLATPLKAIKGLLSKMVGALIGANIIAEVISKQLFYHLVAPVLLHAYFDFLEHLHKGREDSRKLLEFRNYFVTTILHVL